MLVSSHAEVTVANSPVKVMSVPSGSFAEIKSIIITNKAAAAATVDIMSGDGTNADYDYKLLSVIVQAGATLVLDRNVVEGLKAIRDIYVQSDQQPVVVTIIADIK